MAKIHNSPLHNIGPPVDPEKVKDLRQALGLVHDGCLVTGDYEELERRLLEQMNEFFKLEDIG